MWSKIYNVSVNLILSPSRGWEKGCSNDLKWPRTEVKTQTFLLLQGKTSPRKKDPTPGGMMKNMIIPIVSRPSTTLKYLLVWASRDASSW